LKLPPLSSKSNVSEASDDENPHLNEAFHKKHTRQFDIKEFLKLSTPFAMVKTSEATKTKTGPKMQVKSKEGKGSLTPYRSGTFLAFV
jgi:hypothetical protein